MASKSKDVRIEQLRIFEKKLALRLQQLDKKGISKEKAQSDPLVKSLKSKIRETNVRIAALEKFVQDNPKAPEGHFLLGYQFVMMGHKDAAKKQLDQAVTLAPRDKLAQRIIKRL